MTKIKRALIAPYDKTGIEDFARALHERGVALLATSGTAKRLKAAGLPVTEVAEYTGHPEILGGRVKTLHPKVHGGLLGRPDDPEHAAQMQAHGIEPIGLICLNLYPFVETISKPGVTLPEAIEQIDIGGPAMLRAASKNHAHVIPLIDSADYEECLRRMDADELDADYRRFLAAKAFNHTCHYDAAITAYLGQEPSEEEESWVESQVISPADQFELPEGGAFPECFGVAGEKALDLRYGENPHQRAALYRAGAGSGLAGAELLNGKPLSFNNLQDAAGALAAVAEFDEPAAVVVKHSNPCGAAVAETALDAFRRAWEGDPLSAFGGILAFNREVDGALAEAIAEPGRFVEVISAPSYADRALETLKSKPKWGKSVRILACPAESPKGVEVRSLPGGFLVQERDGARTEPADLKVVTKRAPTETESSDLVFAQRVCKHIKSNAIVLAKHGQVVGVGAGQMSRVDAARIAVRKAGKRSEGAVFASDAFLPFNDALEVALDAGVAAAVQPGGSRNDENCIEFADQRGIAMAFTGTRHFLH